jgi:hypothetical protein
MSDQESEESELTTEEHWKSKMDSIPPGRYRKSPFLKITDSLTNWIFVGLIIGGGLYYGIHLILNYRHIHRDIREKGALVVQPVIENGDLSEIGYIFSMRRDTYIREDRWNLVWFIAIPEKGVRYSCQYEGGYQDFKVGDGVKIIRKPVDVADAGEDVYIIGLHDKQMGKASIAWANDLDVLEDMRDPND